MKMHPGVLAAAMLLAVPAFPSGQEAPEAGVYHVGEGVTAPRPTYRPDPDYSEEARRAGVQGTIILRLIVDEQGRPTDIEVVSPRGYGLDDKAVAAIEQWTFRPATKDGGPVKVKAMIEVNFRLLMRNQNAPGERERSDFAAAVEGVGGKNGQGTKRAVEDLKQLAKREYAPALGFLGNMYLTGNGVGQDRREGLKLIERGAARRDGLAMYTLGRLYCEGSLVARDPDRCVQIMDDASKVGSFDAQWSLGLRYENGDGMPRQASRARHYFRFCAARGNAQCRYHLGRLMFETAFVRIAVPMPQ